MTPRHLAQLNVARMREPLESPLLAEFVAIVNLTVLESMPTIDEVARRLAQLRHDGPSADAFTFRAPSAAPSGALGDGQISYAAGHRA